MPLDQVIISAIGSALVGAGEWIGSYVAASWRNRQATKEDDHDEVAVLVEIARPSQKMVEKYLANQGISAPLFVISDKEARTQLPFERNLWEGIVKEFVQTVHGIYRELAPEKLHIFLATPNGLAFALGAAIGHVWSPRVYQFDISGSSYHLIAVASKSLVA